MSHSSYPVEPLYAKYLSRLIRPFSNFDFFFIKNVREKAVQELQLGSGAHVLDLGCGSGGSFPYLVKVVGSTGKVIGVDISHQSCMNARRRVNSNDWKNIEIIEASADKVELSAIYDGALMFAAPDVYASESALVNIMPHLKNRARIAIFGAKLSNRWQSKFLNPLFLFLCRNLSPATPAPDNAPWGLLASRVENIKVEEFFFGSMFMASGTLKNAD
jgi:SAM-dependent methyltransferase